MSPRPRRLPDSAILDAAVKVVSRTGPERFTLPDVGHAVGLSAATLVQRFGSKRSLLLAMLEQTITLVDERFAAAIADHKSPLDRLYAAAIDRASEFEGPNSLSNRFAFVLIELTDPEFQALAAESGRKAMAAFRKMIEDAVEAGELAQGLFDPQHLAETVYAVVIGSMVMWVI